MTTPSNILREVPIFTELTDEDILIIMDMTVRRAYPKNTMIVIEEDQGDTLYIIESGSVKITRLDEDGREVIVIFDVSMRIPGSPGTKYTPYSSYLHGDSISYGERVAMEIKKAIDDGKLDIICT